MSSSPRLALPYIAPAQAQKHVTHNEAVRVLDALVHLRILSFGATQPPASPAAGDAHAVGSAPQGAWSGQGGRVAIWDGAGWTFHDPREGWRAWSAEAGHLKVRQGGAWVPLPVPLQNVDGLGIGTSWDATNRLAVSSPATLLTHQGAGHQVKVNKAASGDTASLLFQSAFTGHAEMGLAGSNDFAVKVSDGTSWFDALSIARGSGRVSLPQGATVAGTVTGPAVQASPTDDGAGRLLVTGAYGMGGLLPLAGNLGVTDGSLVPGHYAYDTGLGSSGGPAGATRGAVLHLRRAAGAGETQTFVVEAGTGGAIPGMSVSRSRQSGAWTAWYAGSLQESGTNANGRWIRQQDGTQTCWFSVSTLTTGEATWTFPVAFSAAGVQLNIQMAVNSGGVVAVSPRYTGKTASSVGVSAFSSANARVAVSVDLLATGRWY